MIDIAIIGTGPAGISCALTLKARGKNFMLFGSREPSNMLVKAHKVSNYPGIIGSGKDIADAFMKQLQSEQIEITEKRITTIVPMGEYFAMLSGQEDFSARAVVLATGVDFGKPIDGEEKFLGRGVSYCATCDGMLYKGKNVAVVSYSKNEEHDADFLADICARVYYLPQYKDDVSVDSRCEILRTQPQAISGEKAVEKLITKEGAVIDVSCVFVLRESIAPQTLVPGVATENGRIIVDRNMATNIAGLFACGDITGSPFQIAKAVGEGNVAALSADKYLSAKQ